MMTKSPMREKFLEKVYKEKCTFKLDDVEVNDVESKTLQLLRNVLDAVGEAYPTFKISEIIKSGSFYEGTKVGPPDEFDFMIVLENLSRIESIELQQGCTPWFQKIKVVDPDTKATFGQYLDNEKEYLGDKSKLEKDFWTHLSSVLNVKTFSAKTKNGTITTIPNDKQKFLLKYAGSFKLSANIPGLVPRDEIEIGIDLMPAIKHPEVTTVSSFAGFPVKFKSDLQATGCHIIAKSCHRNHSPDPPCWFITLGAIELKTMQNMDEKHKKAYKVLKSLMIAEINYTEKCINLSSYMLKTALMFHVHGETECSSEHFGDCIEDILSYLRNNFYNLKMPCFFARDMDTWGVLVETPGFHWDFELTAEEKRIGDRGVLYALLWLYFWYRSMGAAEAILSEKSCESELYMNITHRFGRFKASVGFFVRKYCIQEDVWKVRIERSSININQFNTDIENRFSFYIRKLKENYKMHEILI